jgi:sugar/nucleoside kinase (ribokinase family)
VVGSLAYDDVQTPFERHRRVLGGAASYFAFAASLYAPVRLVGVVGTDFDEADLSRLRAKGVDVSGVERREGRSFHWQGRYDYDLGNAETLATDLGVFGDWKPSLPERFLDSPFVFLANIDPDIQLALLEQVRGRATVVLDTMNFWIDHKREALARVVEKADLVSVNEAEARQFVRTFSIVRAAREILALGPRALIVKRGEYGATLFTRSGSFWAPAYPLEKIQDPTGAGDSFAGGFLGHLARCGAVDDHELRRAVIHGIVCASFAVERFSVDGIEALDRETAVARYRSLRELVTIGAEAVADADPFAPGGRGPRGRGPSQRGRRPSVQ